MNLSPHFTFDELTRAAALVLDHHLTPGAP